GPRHGVLAGADEIAEAAIGELVHFGRRAGGQPLDAEQPIDGARGPKELELPARIGPQVFFGVWQQHGPRSTKRDQTVLVERQLARVVIKLLKVAAEPVRKRGVDALDRFGPRVAGAAGGGATTASLQRNDDGDSFVKRAGQQGRFAVPRMADDGD